MIAIRFLPLIAKQVVRQRMRSLLTVLGVATAMFLFCTIESVQEGMRRATHEQATDTTLIVYRAGRYCPFTSNLPEHVLARIEAIPGVASVLPMKIMVSNCRASLDVVTFRGVPAERAAVLFRDAGAAGEAELTAWLARSDGALLGETLAQRRGLSVGQRFDANGVTVTVSGILDSDEPQDQNVAYVHLRFLQYAPGVKNQGAVTQFVVRVDDAERMQEVARAIDAELAHDPEPTATYSEKAFVGRAAGDLIGLVSFTRLVGFGCALAVLALVANTIVLASHARKAEHAVLQTLGYRGTLVGQLVLAEGLLLAGCGGALGAAACGVLLSTGGWALANEGLSINFEPSARVLASSFAVSVALGAVAGLLPAWQASRRDIVTCLRST